MLATLAAPREAFGQWETTVPKKTARNERLFFGGIQHALSTARFVFSKEVIQYLIHLRKPFYKVWIVRFAFSCYANTMFPCDDLFCFPKQRFALVDHEVLPSVFFRVIASNLH